MDPNQEQQEDFLSERALNGIFTSEWYAESMTMLGLPPPARRVLDDIADESERQRENAPRTFNEWQARIGHDDAERMALFDTEMLHVTRHGFLRALIEAKDASAQFFQKAALLAPRDLADQFAQQGAQDYDHAMRLRKLLVDTYYTDSPYPFMEAGGGTTRP